MSAASVVSAWRAPGPWQLSQATPASAKCVEELVPVSIVGHLEAGGVAVEALAVGGAAEVGQKNGWPG
jgi:hypothetical protein